jgi:hypothetical protein
LANTAPHLSRKYQRSRFRGQSRVKEIIYPS